MVGSVTSCTGDGFSGVGRVPVWNLRVRCPDLRVSDLEDIKLQSEAHSEYQNKVLGCFFMLLYDRQPNADM